MEAAIGAGGAFLVGLVGLIGVMWNRSRNGNGTSGVAEKLVALMESRDESFTEMVRTQQSIVDTQRQIVDGQARIQQSITRLVELHVQAEGAMGGWTRILDEAVRRLKAAE